MGPAVFFSIFHRTDNTSTYSNSPSAVVSFRKGDTMFIERNRFKLRDYQDKCVNAALQVARSEKQTRTMVNAPTGSGKTYIEVGYVKNRVAEGRNCLILANSQEQLEQTVSALRKANLNFSVEYGPKTAADSADKIILSTVQTMRSRMGSYQPERFDDIIVDECHHSLAPSHRRVFAHFQALKPPGKGSDPRKYTHTSMFGVTATPGKTSISQDLVDSCFTDGVCADFDTRAAMESGILCRAEGRIKNIGKLLDLSSIELDAKERNLGDYDGMLVSEILQSLTRFIAADIISEGNERKTIVFAPSVEFAKKLAKEMRKQSGSRKIAEIYSDTPDQQRTDTLRKFNKANNHSSYFLINYSVATEGFDSPGVNTIYNLRPTKRPELLTQMLGRGLRTDPENPDKVCRLIGLDWFGRECCQPSLILSPNELLNDRVTQEMRKGKFVDMLESIERNEKSFLEENRLGYTVELEDALRIANVRESGPRFRRARLADLRIIANAGVDVSREMSYQTARDLAKEISARYRDGKASLRQIDCLLNSRVSCYKDIWEISEREAAHRLEDERPTRRVSELLLMYGIKGVNAAKALEIADAIRTHEFELPQRYSRFVNTSPVEYDRKAPEKRTTDNVVRVHVIPPKPKVVLIKKKSCLEQSPANGQPPRQQGKDGPERDR